MTPTSWTGANSEAAALKFTAVPPTTSSRCPAGVVISSSATLPTTTIGAGSATVSAGGSGRATYPVSRDSAAGAEMPSTRKPLRSVTCTARASRIRPARSGTSARMRSAGSRLPW